MDDPFVTLDVSSALLPFLFGMLKFRQLNADSLKVLMYTILKAVINILLIFFAPRIGSLLFLYSIGLVSEICFLYILLFPKYVFFWSRFLVHLTFGAYILIWLSTYFIKFSNSYLITEYPVPFFLYVFWIVLFLQQEYSANGKLLQKEDPFTWYLLGIVVYTSVALIILGIAIYSPDRRNIRFWMLINLSSIVMNILFSLGLFIKQTRRPSLISER